MFLIVGPERYSAPPVEIWMIPSLPASANPCSAAFSVCEDETLIAGKANDFDFAASSMAAYFSGVATGMRKLLGKGPDVPNPNRPRLYGRTMLTLTPQARAVATFTLAVLLILGSLNRLGIAFVQAI